MNQVDEKRERILTHFIDSCLGTKKEKKNWKSRENRRSSEATKTLKEKRENKL